MKLSANIIYQNSQSELKKHNQLQQQLVSERDELKKIVTDKDVVLERLLKGVEALGKKNKDLEQKILKLEAKSDGKSLDECENILDNKDSEAE